MKADNYFRVGKDVFPFQDGPDGTIYEAWRHANFLADCRLTPKGRAKIVVWAPPVVRGPWDVCGLVGIGPLEDGISS